MGTPMHNNEVTESEANEYLDAECFICKPTI